MFSGCHFVQCHTLLTLIVCLRVRWPVEAYFYTEICCAEENRMPVYNVAFMVSMTFLSYSKQSFAQWILYGDKAIGVVYEECRSKRVQNVDTEKNPAHL